MAAIKFRAHRLGEHEVITPGALENLVGQVSTFNWPGHIGVATVTAAEVVDGWLVLTTDLETDMLDLPALLSLFGYPPEYSVREKAFTPRPADWSRIAEEVAPARVSQVLGSIGSGPNPTRQ